MLKLHYIIPGYKIIKTTSNYKPNVGDAVVLIITEYIVTYITYDINNDIINIYCEEKE
ncbi:unnamed protein product [Clostridium phage HM2]|nr:unnamed protein product [Clostridium phage HM2]